jgi:MerR family transcriptional regulator, heat shock protein HspR
VTAVQRDDTARSPASQVVDLTVSVPDGGDLEPSGAGRAVYVISVAAELAGVHPQTLRVYERKGLLDPSRTTGGSRRFSERDLARLRRIQDLTAAGLNLEGVRRVLELEKEIVRLRGELDRVRAEAKDAVERIHRQYRRDLVPVDPTPVPYAPLRTRIDR